MSKWLMLSLALLSTHVFSADKVIYGNDDRLDVYEVTDSSLLNLAESTAAMIPQSALTENRGVVTISGKTLKEGRKCESERFANQRTAALCSGFLVGDDLLVTAGHCIKRASDCAQYKWVFNYKAQSEDQKDFFVTKEDVYSCDKILEHKLSHATKDDYTLLKLKRVVSSRSPLTYRKEGQVEIDEPLVVIGHPSGLPTKIAGGAKVRENTSSIFFKSNLDTYGGNSGSAVFNESTLEVEGILVRGETDYVYDSAKGCYVSNVCTDDGCRGEDVTRITNIEYLKK